MRGTFGNISDITEANSFLHGQDNVAYGDAGYQGAARRADATKDITWHVAMRPCKRRALKMENEADALTHKAQKLKAGIRAKAEHPFRMIIKHQFGHTRVRYRGLKKNTAQLVTLFALSNLWMVRGELMEAKAWVRPKTGQAPCRALKTPKRAEKMSGLQEVDPEIP